MKVIGTAGHIDHGKSTLVRLLTGIDPDRLQEEKQRGMTIDLGFAWLTLPSGEDVSIVDVPGHERFVKNMLAGAGGIDVALIVVAADEGVMPQTREHLEILQLLGVDVGVVALTKVDLVEDEWLELAGEDVREFLRGRPLAAAPIVPVSAVTGRGVPDLLARLDEAVKAAPPPVNAGKPFVPLDRVFSVSGFGTVATGTLHGGSLGVGTEVEIVPGSRRARIRGLQTHRQTVERAEPGSRVAINLAGVTRTDLTRGDVLAPPGEVGAVQRFDANLRVLESAPFALAHGSQAALHIGAAERAVTVSVLGADEIRPGDSGWVQIRTPDAVAVVPDQAFILRLPAPARTIAGGRVVDTAPRHRRWSGTAVERLEAMTETSADRRLLAILADGRRRTEKQIADASGMAVREVRSALGGLQEAGSVVSLGASFVSAREWESLEGRARRVVARYHLDHPLKRGISREELRNKLGLTAAEWPSAVGLLVEHGVLREVETLLADPHHRGGTAGREGDVERTLAILRADPFAPPSGAELLAAAGVDEPFLEAMAAEGRVVRVHGGLYFDAQAYDLMVCKTVDLIREGGPVTVGQVRDSLGTSRKYIVHFLEHLDAERITKRAGDTRSLGSRAPACA